MGGYVFWSEADHNTAVSMRAEGKSFGAIGKVVGRSGSGVYNHLAFANGHFRRLKRTCSVCDASIYDRSASGMCKPCHLNKANRDEALNKKRLVALHRARTAATGVPPEYLDQYNWLKRNRGMTAPEAQAIIREEIKRARAKLSPFERQEADLRAKLERNDATPIASNDMFRRRAA